LRREKGKEGGRLISSRYGGKKVRGIGLWRRKRKKHTRSFDRNQKKGGEKKKEEDRIALPSVLENKM